MIFQQRDPLVNFKSLPETAILQRYLVSTIRIHSGNLSKTRIKIRLQEIRLHKIKKQKSCRMNTHTCLFVTTKVPYKIQIRGAVFFLEGHPPGPVQNQDLQDGGFTKFVETCAWSLMLQLQWNCLKEMSIQAGPGPLILQKGFFWDGCGLGYHQFPQFAESGSIK